MSKTIRRLGRGLDSLVSDLRGEPELKLAPHPEPQLAAQPAATPAAPEQQRTAEERHAETRPIGHVTTGPDGAISTMMLGIGDLSPNPFQPRDIISDDDILSISASIRKHGILQPISARMVGGQYQIIAGERRWRAAKSIGMSQVPVIVRQASDEQMLELALIENLQREDLNAMDRARAYHRFCTHFGLKPEEVADRLGEDRSTVVNYLRLLDLAEPIRAMVSAGKLSMAHARCLLGEVNEVHRMRLAEAIVANELSVRAVEEIIRRGKAYLGGSATTMALAGQPPVAPGTRQGRLRSAHLQDLEQRFERAVKTKVSIHEGRKRGSGRITIEYYTLDDFDRIASLLGVKGDD